MGESIYKPEGRNLAHSMDLGTGFLEILGFE